MRVALLCFGTLIRAARLTISEYPSCNCNCCETEISREALEEARDGGADEVEIRCYVAAEVTNNAGLQTQCQSQQCRQIPGDHVLQSKSQLLDFERFCNAECEPSEPFRGSNCLARPNVAESAQRHDMVRLIQKRRKKKREGGTAVEDVQKLVQDAKAVKQKAELAAKTSADAAAKGAAEVDEMTNVMLHNEQLADEIVPKTLAQLRMHGVSAAAVEQDMATLEAGLHGPATNRALDQMDVQSKAKEQAAYDARMAKGTAIGAETKAKQVKEAGAAGEAAAKPYLDLQAQMTEQAGIWAKRGDQAAELATNWEREASLAQMDADQQKANGKMYEARIKQKVVDYFKGQAASYAGMADGFYKQSKSITDSLPTYAAQADAAKAHASYALNPDAPPPRPPLV